MRGLSGVGGCSGRAIKPIPISGMGGIETRRDAAEFLLLGANYVQITPAVMQYGACIIDDLTNGLHRYLREKALPCLWALQGLGVENVAKLGTLNRRTKLLPRIDCKSAWAAGAAAACACRSALSRQSARMGKETACKSYKTRPPSVEAALLCNRLFSAQKAPKQIGYGAAAEGRQQAVSLAV